MTNIAQPPPQGGAGGIPFPEWFTYLAANYGKFTGNSTRDLFALALDDIHSLAPITASSRIQDNAAGPGTAASVLLSRLPPDIVSTATIIITDNVPAMISAARNDFSSHIPSPVTVQEMDSLSLPLPDNHLSHSILNFSIFSMSDPLKCLTEINRTLQPGGVAALLTWKRFGAAEVIRAAQKMVRPDLPPIAVPKEEFTKEGVLADLAVEAGFAREGLMVLEKKVVVKGDDLDGMRKEYFPGFISQPARKGWTEEENGRWEEVTEKAIQGEVEKFGGILFEAWVVLARK